MVNTVLAGQNKWDHCTHLTWNLGHRMKWDHYKHPWSYHFGLCWGWFFLIRLYLWVSIWAPKGSVCLWFAQFCPDRKKWDHCRHFTYKLGHWLKWDHCKHPLSYHFVLCWGWSFLVRLYLWASIWAPKGSVCLWFVRFLPGQNKWDHCAHLTSKLGHWLRQHHCKHPLLYHVVLCWSDFFSLDYICGYEYELLKGQCVYGLYSFVWAEQVRPLHTLLEIWVTGWSETTASIPYHITLYHVGLMLSHQIISLCVTGVSFKCQCVHGLYSFAWTEQVRPLHASYLKTRSLTEVRPLQVPFHITLCRLLGCCFHIKSYLWVPKRTVQMSLCP